MSIDTPEIVFPEHFGFCGGVAGADSLVGAVAEQAREFQVPVYGLHEIVHNKDVVRKHEANGVTFVDDIDSIPDGSAVVVSAHGAGPETFDALKSKSCETFDATCPLVIHTHKGAEQARQNNEKVIYVCHGKPGEVEKLHDEVAGMVGHLDFSVDNEGTLKRDPIERSYLELDEDLSTADDLFSDSGKYRIVTQTTLNADECLRYREEIRDHLLGTQPDASVTWSNQGDVCRAVADRQAGIEQLVELKPRRIVVVTDPGSKNGMGYFKMAKDLAEAQGLDTEVIALAGEAEAADLDEVDGKTAITASASTPNETITSVAQSLGHEGAVESKDRVFKLRDGKPEVIAQKLADHALRLAEVG